ncbi:MAG: glycoside hydrolase family 88 protein [Lachnospiraceae bacterium]|nr:glycoside hydrolase family 88 protein [Lachnospiraceae bacterium]
MEKWIDTDMIKDHPEVTTDEVKKALSVCISGVLKYLDDFKDCFPYAASVDNFYRPCENKGWTTGFYTGQLWLSYENTKESSDKGRLLDAANAQVRSFYDRVMNEIDVDHHDMGFLYSPSCVAAYKLTGNKTGREAAIKAADMLIKRFQSVGEFIQAWGKMGADDNYRFIIDCLLNLPLLYWASLETGDDKYRDIAEKHIHTAMNNVIREDDSTWHTVFMDKQTGAFHHGATCQGYKDGSAWARGQAWGIYGCAVAYKYTKREEYIGYFKRVCGYFLRHLPYDLVPMWDLSFGEDDKDTEPRDSSSAVIAACGMLEMSKYMNEEDGWYYTSVAKRIIKSVIDDYSVKDINESNGRLLHGTYSKKSPYNTCTPEGVDECVLWGDYYYMEALTRLLDPDWIIYW